MSDGENGKEVTPEVVADKVNEEKVEEVTVDAVEEEVSKDDDELDKVSVAYCISGYTLVLASASVCLFVPRRSCLYNSYT